MALMMGMRGLFTSTPNNTLIYLQSGLNQSIIATIPPGTGGASLCLLFDVFAYAITLVAFAIAYKPVSLSGSPVISTILPQTLREGKMLSLDRAQHLYRRRAPEHATAIELILIQASESIPNELLD